MGSHQILLSFGAGITPGAFSDDFEDGSINAVWQNGPGNMLDFVETGGTATAPSGSPTGAMVKIGAGTTFGPDHSSTITIPATGSVNQMGPTVRMQWTGVSDVSDCYFIFINTDSATAGVWKLYNNGSFAQIQSSIFIGGLSAGNTVTLRASGQNTVTLEILINGGSAGSVSDDGSGAGGAAYNTGQPGFLLNVSQFIAAFSAQEP